MDVLTFGDVRANLKSVMDRVTGDREEVVARRKGGLVVSLETWNAVTGTLHLLSTPENAAALRRSIAELDAGCGTERDLIGP